MRRTDAIVCLRVIVFNFRVSVFQPFSVFLVGEVGPRMTCRGGISRAFSTYRRRSSGADVHHRSITVTSGNRVIDGVTLGAVLDDQIAGGIYIDTAAITDDVVPLYAIVAASGMNAGAIIDRVVFPDETLGADAYAIPTI